MTAGDITINGMPFTEALRNIVPAGHQNAIIASGKLTADGKAEGVLALRFGDHWSIINQVELDTNAGWKLASTEFSVVVTW